MKFEVHSVYLFTLLLVVIVPALTSGDSLRRHKHRRQKRAYVEDLKCKQDILKNGMSLINYGIEKITSRAANLQGGFFESLRLVFNEIQRNKSATKSIIEEGLIKSFPEAHESLVEKINVSKSLEFESSLIWLYTKVTNSSTLYYKVNRALSGHECTSKKLEIEDQHQAAYTTALLATLLYWEDVKEYSGVTYRMFNVNSSAVNVHEQYRKGSIVVFPALTSSSKDRNIAFDFAEPPPLKNILLVMDNLQPSSLRPRDIMEISYNRTQKECLYPSLAEFKVMLNPVEKNEMIHAKNISYYEIKLQLVGDDYISDKTSPVQGSVNLRVIAILISLMYI